ncbi:MAG: DNA topoisomerase VI subunit B, partial [Phycisphaerae bacterium]
MAAHAASNQQTTGANTNQLKLRFAGPVKQKPSHAKPAASRHTQRSRAAAGTTPRRNAKAAPPATAETMARAQREISISEFFAKNRHLLGFDNKRKALLTTIKEAVDNSLDACEEAGILPDLDVAIRQVDDDRFIVCVRDNGPGIVKDQIPNIFGKLLYGSKFHRLKMSRGQQGIGISAAGMYGLLTTGKSVKINSRTGPKKAAHHYEVQIDTKKNQPTIVAEREVNVDWPSGTEIEIELVASYNKGRQSVDEYLELTAIANPHAHIRYRPPVGTPIELPRGSQTLPEQTHAIKPHPYGIELGVLIKMLHDTKSHWLSGFLSGEFSRVSNRTAEAICRRARLNPRARPRRIARHEAETLFKALQDTRLMAPPTNCLAPIGTRDLLSGLLKGVRAEFYSAATRDPAVYRGNPFQIEVGIAYGGELGPDPTASVHEAPAKSGQSRVKNGRIVAARSAGPSAARIIRFANRVPLLHQQSACCLFKGVLDTDWRRYGLSQPGGGVPHGPLVVMLHMASVWVPFTSESKEAVADYDEIRKEIRLALQECGRKLQAYLNRRKRQKYEGRRRDAFERYIGEVVAACASLKRIDKQELHRNLTAVAQRITATADEQLDDEGRVLAEGSARGDARVKAKRGGGATAGKKQSVTSRTADADPATEYGDNTVVVDRANAA